MVGGAEAQRVEVGDGARAHREHVAHDAADAGRRALVGLDVGGVVVALHLEDDGIAVAEIDHAGVLARSLDDLRARGRQRLQPDARGFVGAVLAPHDREDAEFADRRLAAEDFEQALVLVRLEAVLGDDLGRDFSRRRLGHQDLVGRSDCVRLYGLGVGLSPLRLPWHPTAKRREVFLGVSPRRPSATSPVPGEAEFLRPWAKARPDEGRRAVEFEDEGPVYSPLACFASHAFMAAISVSWALMMSSASFRISGSFPYCSSTLAMSIAP